MVFVKNLVTTMDFHNIKEIIDCLLSKSKIPHREYESVKLYGDSAFIMKILKYIIRRYDDITIAAIDIMLSDIDSVCKDIYVMSLTDGLELFIQSAYNGEILLFDESKFVICGEEIYRQICDRISDDTSVVIGNFILK